MTEMPANPTTITPMHAITPAPLKRPPRALLDALQHIGSATASGELNRLGFRGCTIVGPTAWTPGASVVGPALTLQFLPKRADVYDDAEYVAPERQLHRHVLYQAAPGDVVAGPSVHVPRPGALLRTRPRAWALLCRAPAHPDRVGIEA